MNPMARDREDPLAGLSGMTPTLPHPIPIDPGR